MISPISKTSGVVRLHNFYVCYLFEELYASIYSKPGSILDTGNKIIEKAKQTQFQTWISLILMEEREDIQHNNKHVKYIACYTSNMGAKQVGTAFHSSRIVMENLIIGAKI